MTVESAAESLLMPESPQEEQAQEPEEQVEETEDSQETEAEDEDATPDEEAESDEAEEDGEDAEDDGEEVDPEDDEDENEDDEAEQSSQSHTVKVDGEEVKVTLDELKRSYSGQSYIQKRMKEVGDKAREAEDIYNSLLQERNQIQQFVQQVQQQGVMQQPQPPARELLNQDPIAYMEQEADYKEAMQQYQQQQQQFQQVAQQQSAATKAAQQRYLQEQQAKLAQDIPEFADADKAREVQGKIRTAATEIYGFTDQELSSVVDARHVKVLDDARRYRELMANKERATKKVKTAKPSVKAGSRRKVDPKRKAREQAQKRLKDTGSVDAAVELLFLEN